MKITSFFIYLFSAAIIFSACSKDPAPIDDNSGKEEEVPKEGVFIVTTRNSPFAGADVIHTVNSLDSGLLVTVGTGIQQSAASINYLSNNGFLYSLPFNRSAPGPISIFKATADKKITALSEIQTESMTAIGNVGDELLLFKNAWQPEEEFTQWFRVDTKTQEIVASGELSANKLAGNGEKAFFTTPAKVGDKVFAPFWSIESGRTFGSAYQDSSYIAVYSYPEMKLEKVIRDDRSGGIGTLLTSGIEVDEQGDTYIFNMKMTYDKAGINYSTKTPVAITKIKKGTTEYDESYFFDITKASNSHYIWQKSYLGKGYFLLTMCPKAYAYATPFYSSIMGGGMRFAIANVQDQSFKWVTGAPASADIVSSTGENNYSALDGTGYVGIYYNEDKVGKSTIFKVDAPTAVATPTLTTDNKAAITTINWVEIPK
ncbi:DUF4374 domain-containing protein [Sphingobacterium sp. JB170]|uniref:DUF4374 domain-containing protein n=1 Tax=Sphingobacterium sp. JB170 TaxID=1434842 RepID=UPI00097F3E73|nr:DUF4374 domain-containing protein [Sphingobacterium sp. JB170]SJN23074.1 hypothetical protein FM107_03715 [Sphingobacterium sp. JB170]